MIVAQYILCKKTQSGAQQWRQFNLVTNQQGTKWFIKEFYGRSKRGISFKLQHEFGWEDEARLGIDNLIDNRLNEGYINYDRIIQNMVDTPFSKFSPVNNVITNLVDAKKASYLNDSTHRLIPLHGGIHCCIKVGFDTAFHVEAKNNKDQNIPLPEDVISELVEMVKLSEYETFVLEAFVTRTKVTFVDVLCVNGIVFEKPLSQRMALLSGLKGDDVSFTQLKKPSQINLLPSFTNQAAKPYWYAVKCIKGCTDPLKTVTPLIPQYFVFNVMASQVRDDILARREKKQRLKLLVSKVNEQGGHELIDVGELILPLSFPSHKIKLVESVGMKMGKLIKPRICMRKYESKTVKSSNSKQFDNLENHWAANLN